MTYQVTYSDADQDDVRTLLVEAPDSESAVDIVCQEIAWTIVDVRRVLPEEVRRAPT